MNEFRILGPLEVQHEGRLVPLGGNKQRAVLAILLLRRGEVVSADRLVDELWGERPPDTATKTVQVYVSRLRKELGQGVVVTRGGGYVLELDADQLDAERFERLTTEGREALERGDALRARDLLREALALWRGPPLGDLAYEPFAQTEIARLEELQLVALEHRIEVDLELGETAALIPELETLVREHPARERLRAQMILALYRAGRQADALASYRDARRAMVEELGLEPGRELQELERAILGQDPALDSPMRGRTADMVIARARRGGLVLALGGGLLLAALVAIIAVGGEDDAASRQVVANSLAVIDPGSNEVVATVSTGVLPTDVAASGGYIWVANRTDDTVTQLDPDTKRLVSTTAVVPGVGGLAADSRDIWISDGRGQRLSRIDPQFRSVKTVRLMSPERGLDSANGSVAAGDGSVWAPRADGAIARIDAATDKAAPPITAGNSPTAIAIGAGSVWVADDEDNTVLRIDPDSANAVTSTTPVGQRPGAIAVGAGAVWVTNAQDDTVARLDPRTASVTATIPVGRRPAGVAVGAGSVWVTNSLSGTVSRIDPETNRVEDTVELSEAPWGVTVAHGFVWVSVQERAPRISAPAPASGGVVHVVEPDDPGPTDPALNTGFQLQYATCALLYNYPDRPFPEGSKLRPEIADGPPSVSADGLTYRIRIRPGFRFSPPSNEPVTAQALAHTIERVLNPRMGSGGADLLADVADLRARGDRLVIRVTRPTPDLTTRLAALYFCAVPPNTPIDPEGVDAVSTAGPYYVAAHVPGRSLVLRRNPGYAGPRPHHLAEIRYRIGAKPGRGAAAVEAGRADYVTIDPSLPARVERRLIALYGPRSQAARAGRQRVFTQPAPGVYYFVFNTRRGPFTDVRLRRAVNYALDRSALADNTGVGEQGRPTDQYVPAGLPGFEDFAIYPLGGPDIATARRLAGVKPRQAVLYTCNYPACTRHAQILRANLEHIGVELEVRQFNLAEMFRRTRKVGEPFDLAYSNWFVDYADPSGYINAVFGPEGASPGGFRDAEAERRMDAAASLTGQARLDAYADVDRFLSRRAVPAAAFATGTASHFLSARMGCQVLHPIYGLDLAALCIRRR